MPVYVAVAVNIPTQIELFHYHLPEAFADRIKPGHLVEVPFGTQTVHGVVFEYVDVPEVHETRPVLGLVDEQIALTQAQLTLAWRLSQDTLSPLSVCLRLMLPPGLAQQVDTLYQLPETTLPGTLVGLQQRLINLLQQRGPLRGRQIDQSLPNLDWRSAARSLVRSGKLRAQSVLPPRRVRPKMIRTAALACPPEQVAQAMNSLGRGEKVLARRQAILQYLLRENTPVDVTWLYAASGGSLPDLTALEEQGLVLLSETQAWRDPLAELQFTPTHPLELTGEQNAIWQQVQAALQAAAAGKSVRPHLLHGVTGSGKTEIYLHAVAEVLRQGRQAILLVPEIAMTPQTIRRVLARFPGQVGIMHSDLSEGERYDTWQRARQGKINIMVGPRSALFTPFTNLGLIVIDECHDDSYYQSEYQPAYDARQAAITYAQLCGAVCLLGSATPGIESRYLAAQGQWCYLTLPARILAHRQAIEQQMKNLRRENQAGETRYKPLDNQAETVELPPVTIVDMRQELKAGNRTIFSRALQAALRDTLSAGQQAILFINRRGAATHVFCRDCGYVVKCPRCDIPLVYHSVTSGPQNLICHRCNYRRQMPTHCPNCRGTRIRQLGTGTERVEEEVQKLLSEARVLRWDAETTHQKGSHAILLTHFGNHQADILVGTQMIAKGLDLPLVTLVGVVLADSSLNFPDLRAAERTFQVLTQVAGRAGRSPLGGQVILQTFQPEHYVIRAAADHDYESFYTQELAYRKLLGYPPFARLVRLEYRHHEADRAEKTALALAQELQAWLAQEQRSATELIGPAPCFFARQAGAYRWQIILRGPDPAGVLRGRNLGDWKIEVDPPSLL
jgi:primosomal protein N' (replication factor Y) (superfamily II helicase)